MNEEKKRDFDYEKIQKELADLEKRLVSELHEKLGKARNASTADPSELLDMASEGELDYMSTVSAESDSVTIEEIQRALQKLEEETYGICEACGQDISDRRLEARPFAVLCIRCKEQEERHGYVPGSEAVASQAHAGVTVDLSDEDVHEAERSASDLFRDIEEMEISEIY